MHYLYHKQLSDKRSSNRGRMTVLTKPCKLVTATRVEQNQTCNKLSNSTDLDVDVHVDYVLWQITFVWSQRYFCRSWVAYTSDIYAKPFGVLRRKYVAANRDGRFVRCNMISDSRKTNLGHEHCHRCVLWIVALWVLKILSSCFSTFHFSITWRKHVAVTYTTKIIMQNIQKNAVNRLCVAERTWAHVRTFKYSNVRLRASNTVLRLSSALWLSGICSGHVDKSWHIV